MMKNLADVILAGSESRKHLIDLAYAACHNCVPTGKRTHYCFGDGSRLIVESEGEQLAWAESA